MRRLSRCWLGLHLQVVQLLQPCEVVLGLADDKHGPAVSEWLQAVDAAAERARCAAQAVDADTFSRSADDFSSAGSSPPGQWYQALCGDTSWHARHCVLCHSVPQPGHTPRVQKVFHTVPQLGTQIQRSSARGRQPHRGQ